MSLFQRFLDANHALCRLLDRVWPYPLGATFWVRYEDLCADCAAKAEPARVVDVGAGRMTPYATRLSLASVEVIGVDILSEDLEANQELTVRIKRDIATQGMPEEAGNAGLITSRMVLEHIPDQDRFAAELFRSLASDGRIVHLFAARYSLFATLNRLLPEGTSQKVLFRLRPESADIGGFETFYDRTHALAAEEVFRRAGFVDVETAISYQVSQYFHFFFPLFVVARLWETMLHALGLKNLGSFVLLSARRP